MAMSAKPALPGNPILSAKQRAQQCTPGRFWKAVLWKLKPSSWGKIQPFPKSFSLSRKLRTLKEIAKELDKILPVVVRVHGYHHPELLEVAALYEELKASANAEIIRNCVPPQMALPPRSMPARLLRRLTGTCLHWRRSFYEPMLPLPPGEHCAGQVEIFRHLDRERRQKTC